MTGQPSSLADKPLLLAFLILGGWILLMWINPIRQCFRDGFRAVRRYPTMWMILGAFGAGYALFQLGVRVYLHAVLPASQRPVFVWAREAWRDPQYWLTGSPESLWYLKPEQFLAALSGSVLSTLESLAGLFNNVVSTFPLSALAAVLFLVNWQGHHAVLARALQKRFGQWRWPVHIALLLCAVAAVLKPLIYAAPPWLLAHGGSVEAATLWYQWSPVLAWLSFLFEYLFGVCIQIYLLLMAYVWIRGMSFTPSRLLDAAIRRFSYVVKWAALVMLLSTLLIDLPLIFKNFPLFASWFPEDKIFGSRLQGTRMLLSLFLILAAPIQITLTLHSESLRKALADHLRYFGRNFFAFICFAVCSGLTLWILNVCDECAKTGFGEGTALWVGWHLSYPWIAGAVYAWLLASWVCLFRRTDTHHQEPTQWIKF